MKHLECLRNWLLSEWIWILIFIVAIASGLLVEIAGTASAPCYSPNNLERRQIICREIDYELNVACYWIEGEDDIFCIQLKKGE